MIVRSRITGVGSQRLSLYLMIFLTQLGTAAAVPILPELRDEFGVSIATVSLVSALWGMARLVFDLPLGVAIERISPGRLLLAGTLMIALGGAMSAFAPTFELLLLGRLVSGGGAAVVSITAVVGLLALSTAGTKGRVLGIYQAALQAGASVSPIVGGFASALFGWPAAFMVAALGGVAGALVVWLAGAGRRSEPATTPSGTPDAPVAAERAGGVLFQLWLMNYATFVLFFLTGGLTLNAIPLFGDSLGLDAAGIGLVLGIATGLRFTVSVIGSILSDHYGRYGILLLGFVVILAALFVFPAVGDVWTFTLVTWLLAVGRLGNAVPVAILSDRLPASRHGRWVSINRFVADLALLAGPIIVGVAIELAGFAAAFYVAGVMVVSVIVLMVVGRRMDVDRRPASRSAMSENALVSEE